MNKKNTLKDLIVNDKNIDKPVFSEKFKKIIFNIVSSIRSIDTLKHIGAVDASVDTLKPVEQVDTRKPKDITKALHSKISSRQKTNIRRGDSVADILARIFQSMNESRLEMIKSSELKRNFEDAHTKDSKLAKKRKTYKKYKFKKDKFGIAGLLTMGLIVNFGDIVKWATSLAEPFTEFIDKIKSEFESFDLTKKTEELAGVISSFISDMKTSLLQGIDNFLNTWVEELLSWIEKTSGFIKFNRENIPHSDLSGTGYKPPKTPETPEATQTPGKMSSATVTPETEKTMNEKRSTGDQAENAFNKTADTAGTLVKGAAGVVTHVGGTVLRKAVDDMIAMTRVTLAAAPDKLTPVEHTALKQKAKHLAAKKKETEIPGFNVPLVRTTKEVVDKKSSDKIMSSIISKARPSDVKQSAEGTSDLSKLLNKEVPDYKKPTMSWNGDVPVPVSDVTPLTTPSVEYNKNQNKNNDLVTKPKTTTSTSTSPAKTVNMGGSQSNVSPGNPAACRNGDKTLNYIGSGNTCKI